jgi:antitoxin PrlF
MTTLKVTARGQVTFRKDLLRHLGIAPGEKVVVHKLPDGRLALSAHQPTGKIRDFIGLLAGKTNKVVTLEQMKKATEDGWAGRK